MFSAKQRLEQFKHETLKAIRDNVIFCQPCKEEVSVKMSDLNAYVSSRKHKLNKEKLAKTNKREEDIAKALSKYDQEKHPKGETLPTSTRVFKVKAVQAFLKSGTPSNRMEYFRDVFEEAGMTPT